MSGNREVAFCTSEMPEEPEDCDGQSHCFNADDDPVATSVPEESVKAAVDEGNCDPEKGVKELGEVLNVEGASPLGIREETAENKSILKKSILIAPVLSSEDSKSGAGVLERPSIVIFPKGTSVERPISRSILVPESADFARPSASRSTSPPPTAVAGQPTSIESKIKYGLTPESVFLPNPVSGNSRSLAMLAGARGLGNIVSPRQRPPRPLNRPADVRQVLNDETQDRTDALFRFLFHMIRLFPEEIRYNILGELLNLVISNRQNL